MKDALGRIQSIAILGGGSDIGVAIAHRAVEDLGVTRVVLAGRRPDRFEAAFSGMSVETTTVEFDALDTSVHESVITSVFADGDIDAVVIAFGALIREQGIATDCAAAVEMMEANYVGAVSAMLHAGRRLVAQGHGHLVVISSIAGQRARPDNYLYGSTRAGLDFVARGMAGELQSAGVGLTIVRPGFVRSRMTAGWKPAPFAVGVADVAKAVIPRLMKSTAEVVWVPPLMKLVALALRVLPSKLLARLR